MIDTHRPDALVELLSLAGLAFTIWRCVIAARR